MFLSIDFIKKSRKSEIAKFKIKRYLKFVIFFVTMIIDILIVPILETIEVVSYVGKYCN